MVHQGPRSARILLQERLTRDLALVHTRRGRLLRARDVHLLGGSSVLRLLRGLIHHGLLMLRHIDTLGAHVEAALSWHRRVLGSDIWRRLGVYALTVGLGHHLLRQLIVHQLRLGRGAVLRVRHGTSRLAAVLADGLLLGTLVVTEIATSRCPLCLQHLELAR